MSKINLLSLFFLIVFFGCANTYKLEKKAVLSFTESSYGSWFSAVKGGGSGFNVYLKIDESDSKKVELKGVYFKGKYANLKLQSLGKYQAFIKQNSKSDRLEFNDRIEDKKDATKEEEIPFVLNDNEAVISCLINEKQKYVKIVLTKKKTLDIPM
jgi:hypothetical protein